MALFKATENKHVDIGAVMEKADNRGWNSFIISSIHGHFAMVPTFWKEGRTDEAKNDGLSGVPGGGISAQPCLTIVE